jgi:YD repeat-containing protein
VNGQTSVEERVYRIDGMAKVGNTRLSFTDLSIPVAGIPITIVRTYDSRVKAREDFGIGWTLDVRRGFYQHNRTPGEGWQILPGGLGLPCLNISETASHLTEVRLSDYESYTFALALSNPAAITGGCTATASFRFLDGRRPGATLEILDGTDVLFLNGDSKVVDADTFAVFNPSRVRLTTADGRSFELDRAAAGITSVRDLNGNTLSITPNGIVHSSGKSVAFTRDAEGRITRITDPNGQTLRYAYDGHGDLVVFTDQAAQQTTFTYDA